MAQATITVSAVDAADTVLLVSPANGSRYKPGTIITLKAAGPGGSALPAGMVVEFVVNGLVVGTRVAAPYSFAVKLSAGVKEMEARAKVVAPVPVPVPPVPIPEPTPIPPVPTPTPTPTPVPPSSKSLVQPSDFQYLGTFSLPYSLYDPDPFKNHMFQASRGFMTGRRDAAGNIHLIISGGGNGSRNEWAAYEVTYPGASLTSPPVAVLVRKWNNILNRTAAQILYQARPDNPNTGELAAASPGLAGFGMVTVNGQERLEIGVVSEYAPVEGDSSRLASILHDDGTVTTAGPWQVDIGAKSTHGAAMPVPPSFRAQHPLAKAFWLHSQARGGQQSTTRGANVVTYDPPSLTTPVDVPTLGAGATVKTRKGLFFDVHHAQPRNGNWRYEEGAYPGGAGRLIDPNGGVTFEPSGCDTVSTNGQGCKLSLVYGGHPNITSLDWTNAAAWIDTPTKHGIVVVGQLTEGHYWYGGSHCAHGPSNPLNGSQGPASQSLLHSIALFNPDDIGKVVDGLIQPYDPRPYYDGVAADFAGWGQVLSRTVTSNLLYQLAATWVDQPSGLLFVSESNAEKYDYDWQPRIHVFKVAQ